MTHVDGPSKCVSMKIKKGHRRSYIGWFREWMKESPYFTSKFMSEKKNEEEEEPLSLVYSLFRKSLLHETRRSRTSARKNCEVSVLFSLYL